MTPKEKVRVHIQIERENARKRREWAEYPHTWREQVETRLLNLRIAEEELQRMVEMGVIS